MNELLMIGSEISSVLSTANIFLKDEYVDAHMETIVPQTKEEIFNEWPRVSDRSYYSDPVNFTGETANWEYDTTVNTFYHPNNTASTEMIVSPYVVSGDFEYDVVMTSTNSDNDLIGAIIALQKTTDNVRFIAVWVQTGGVSGYDRVAVTFADESNEEPSGFGNNLGETIVGNNLVESRGSGVGGWGGDATDPRQFKIRVNAVRTGDNLRIMHSDFNDPDVLLPASEMNISFSTLPRQGNLLATNTRFGFGTNSQPLSYFIDYSMMSASSIDESIIYSYESDNKWVYDDTTNNWSLEGNQINTDFDSSQVIKSINTSVDYKNDSGSLTILMDSGIDDIVVDYSAPANSSYAINTDTLVDKYNFSEPLKVTAVASIQNLNTVSLNTGSITMYTEGTNGSFIVRLESETSNIFDYRKIRLNIT